MTKINLSFSRNNWYIADLWNTGADIDAINKWCTEQFGDKGKPTGWSRWINNNNSLFRFRDEQDYVLFLLRWKQNG